MCKYALTVALNEQFGVAGEIPVPTIELPIIDAVDTFPEPTTGIVARDIDIGLQMPRNWLASIVHRWQF
jgi:hypothetical protein